MRRVVIGVDYGTLSGRVSLVEVHVFGRRGNDVMKRLKAICRQAVNDEATKKED